MTLQKPWELLQEETLGVLQQLGCQVLDRKDQNLQRVYFDTPGTALRQEGSALKLEQGESLRLIWKGSGTTDLPGLSCRRRAELDPAQCPEGAVRDFVREHLENPCLTLSLEADSLEHRVTLADTTAGDRYELIFRSSRYRQMPQGKERQEYALELVSTAGSGRRIRQLGQCLRSRFPELTPDC